MKKGIKTAPGNLQAVILAAGYGHRLRPFSFLRPKPLMEILGMTLLELNISMLKNAGIQEIFINLHYMKETIKEELKVQKDVKIHVFDEQEILGTAGGLKQMSSYLHKQNSTTLLINADILIDVDFSELLKEHLAHAPLASLLLKDMPKKKEYGLIGFDSSHRIVKFLKTRGFLINYVGNRCFVGCISLVMIFLNIYQILRLLV